MCATIWLNGVGPRIRKLFIFSKILTDVLPSPRNPKELFNLRHASARNVIERIFGILKRCFRILELPPQYDASIQALIPAALAALHNFIRAYDPNKIHDYDAETFDFQIGAHARSFGELGRGPVTRDERARANEKRDQISANMWEQYQHHLASRNS